MFTVCVQVYPRGHVPWGILYDWRWVNHWAKDERQRAPAVLRCRLVLHVHTVSSNVKLLDSYIEIEGQKGHNGVIKDE